MTRAKLNNAASRIRIYCAGPLFNHSEKREMEDIAVALEANGFDTFLPQRDGLEFAAVRQPLVELGIKGEDVDSILMKAIFALDVYQVQISHGLVLNLNGRVPDEGAMVEAGIAWAAGKPVIIYKCDSRTMINGNDNPLVAGLSSFRVIHEPSEVAHEFARRLRNGNTRSGRLRVPKTIEGTTEIGRRVSEHVALCRKTNDVASLCTLLLELFGEKRDEPTQGTE